MFFCAESLSISVKSKLNDISKGYICITYYLKTVLILLKQFYLFI